MKSNKRNSPVDFWVDLLTPSVVERFKSKVLIVPEIGCHLWTGCRVPSGYGQIWIGGGMVNSHRVAFVIANRNVDIGNGLILHKCNRPPCVNPDHLYLGTCKDNAADLKRSGYVYPSINKGESSAFAKLNEKDVLKIRAMAEEGISRRAIAKMFSVNHSTINSVVNRLHWKHV